MENKIVGYVYCPECDQEIDVLAEDLGWEEELVLKAYFLLPSPIRIKFRRFLLELLDSLPSEGPDQKEEE